MGDLDREHYTEKHLAKLKRQLGRTPVSVRVGTVICPHCKHLEARWRSEAAPDRPLEAIVRVRCSQCQLSAVLAVP